MNEENRSKNFGLSKGEFDELTRELKRNNEVLFEQIFFSHFNECMNYVKRKYRASHDDAYDATMDAMLDFRMRLIDDKIQYGNLRFLFTQMATQFHIRNMKKYQSVDISEDHMIESDIVDFEDLEKLKVAWKNLGQNCQELLKLNFYSNMKLSAIAEQVDRSAVSIRKQKERCMSKLIDLFKLSSQS